MDVTHYIALHCIKLHYKRGKILGEFADSAEGDLNRYSPLDMEKMRVLMGACLGHDKIVSIP